MRESILITGVAGSGKSTICQYLRALGYESYDIEDMEGMFEMYRKGTRDVFGDYENTPEKIKEADWICHTEKLKELLGQQKSDLAFYCGVASNMEEIMPFFDKVIMLKADPRVLERRLMNREGSNDIGNTEEGRKAVLGWKDWWENEMEKKGFAAVDANGNPDQIIQDILKTAKLNRIKFFK